MSDGVGLLIVRSDTRIGCSLQALALGEQAGLDLPREGKGEGQHVDGTGQQPLSTGRKVAPIPVMEDGNRTGQPLLAQGRRERNHLVSELDPKQSSATWSSWTLNVARSNWTFINGVWRQPR